MTDYYDLIPLDIYDKTIVGHPFVDACNGSIIFHLLSVLKMNTEGKKVLDVGCGTGQVVRLLNGIPGLAVSAQDHADETRKYFKNHPELRDTPFVMTDALEPFAERYDVITSRGVLHHIPKSKRVEFLRNLINSGEYVVIADEAISDYDNENQRLDYCKHWYGFVIKEARRRGLVELAEVESKFLSYDTAPPHDDGMDFKEDLHHIFSDIEVAGAKIIRKQKYGPWKTHNGGFYTLTITKR